MARNVILSIVIPTYNAEDTIACALDSIIEHDNNELVEIIIVNDGSCDNTKLICEEFIKTHKRKNILYSLVNQGNAGHGSSINYAIKNAKGKYLKVLDADDYFEKKNYNEFLRFLVGSDVDLVASDYMEVSVGGGERRMNWYAGRGFKNKKYEDVLKETLPGLLPCAAVKMKTLRKKWRKLDEKCFYDDQEYSLSIVDACKSVSYFKKVVYCYVVGSINQSISNQSLVKNITDHQRVLTWLLKRCQRAELSEIKYKYVFEKMLVPLSYYQYYIAVTLKRSRKDFLSCDKLLKKYPALYNNPKVVGIRLKLHRITKGVFIWTGF